MILSRVNAAVVVVVVGRYLSSHDDFSPNYAFNSKFALKMRECSSIVWNDKL